MSKSPLHIVIQPAYSKECTTFHVSLQLSSSAKMISFFHHNGVTELCKGLGSDTIVEPLALMLAEEILHIDGIDSGSEYMGSVDISKYTIRITYGRAFDQSDIELETLVTIAGVLGVDPDQVTFEFDNSLREAQPINRPSHMTYDV